MEKITEVKTNDKKNITPATTIASSSTSWPKKRSVE